MDYKTSQKLKEDWGKKPCNHPAFEKVFYTGSFLLNYSCTTCGADFTIAQKLEIEESRKQKKAADPPLQSGSSLKSAKGLIS